MPDYQKSLSLINGAVSDIIIGKEHVIELLQIALLSRGHVLLEDVPGTGKTTLAKSFSQAMDGTYKRIQFTPDLMPADVTGFYFFNQQTHAFELREGPVMANILLADEVNRATPRTQSALLEVMEEKQVTIDGTTLKLPAPFMVIATQNPIESQQGNFPLPEAQLDRFLMTVEMGYPDFANERSILRQYMHQAVKSIKEAVVSLEDVAAMQQEVEQVTLYEPVETYLLRLIQATRESADVETGVSPRGSLALMRAAQARAYMYDRSFATPEDIKELAPSVLSHRLVLTLESAMKKTKRQVLKECLGKVPAPVEERD